MSQGNGGGTLPPITPDEQARNAAQRRVFDVVKEVSEGIRYHEAILTSLRDQIAAQAEARERRLTVLSWVTVGLATMYLVAVVALGVRLNYTLSRVEAPVKASLRK